MLALRLLVMTAEIRRVSFDYLTGDGQTMMLSQRLILMKKTSHNHLMRDAKKTKMPSVLLLLYKAMMMVSFYWLMENELKTMVLFDLMM